MSKGKRASSSQSAGDNSAANQASSTSTKQKQGNSPKQKLADWSWLLVLALILVAAIFYALNTQPLFPIQVNPPPSSSQQPKPAKQAALIAEPAFVLLGECGGKVYTFNKGTKKVYVYNWGDKSQNRDKETEREVCKLVEFNAFKWHSSGKLLVVSRRHSTLGGIYLLELNPKESCSPQQAATAGQSQTEFKPEPVLLTNRESEPYFPRNLRIESDLPLVWANKGERFAFVARDIHDKTLSLFIYNLDKKQATNQNDNKLIYTPARNFERITDLVWIKKDTELVFTAINDGQENRYCVNSSGGNFRTWDAQP